MTEYFSPKYWPLLCLDRSKAASLLAGTLMLCSQSTALGDNADYATAKQENIPVEKVLIDADHMQLNIESGKSIYTGNVKISQGELVLTGDKVTLEQSNNEIERITVTGKPARYNHVTEDGEPIQAESERMVYTASQNKLVMTVNAKLVQPDNQVSSQKITYDTLNRIVIAGNNTNSATKKKGDQNNGSEKQRVNITLTPKKKILPTTKKSSTKPTSGKKQ